VAFAAVVGIIPAEEPVIAAVPEAVIPEAAALLASLKLQTMAPPLKQKDTMISVTTVNRWSNMTNAIWNSPWATGIGDYTICENISYQISFTPVVAIE
jgi:hypothetical protein